MQWNQCGRCVLVKSIDLEMNHVMRQSFRLMLINLVDDLLIITMCINLSLQKVFHFKIKCVYFSYFPFFHLSIAYWCKRNLNSTCIPRAFYILFLSIQKLVFFLLLILSRCKIFHILSCLCQDFRNFRCCFFLAESACSVACFVFRQFSNNWF